MRGKNERIFRGGVQLDTVSPNSNANQKRNLGIDALRIFSMFLVIILHIMGHGGISQNVTGAKFYIVSFLNVAACCAVDIYAIISGYVGYSDRVKPFKSEKFLKIWLQVAFYSFLITLCAFCFISDAVGIKALIRSVFPIASNQYWYFSSYAALIFLMPWINRFIRALTNKELTVFVTVLCCLFSVFMVFVCRLGAADPFLLGYGYSSIWLAVLYVFGAWAKRLDIPNKVRTKYAWIAIAFCVLISWLFKDVLEGFLKTGSLVGYTSPTILLTAMSWLVIFAKMKPGKIIGKVINFFAPAAFGVYLIHDNNLVREYFVSRYFQWIANAPALLIAFEIIGCALGVLIVGLLIEKIRLTLFKVFGVNKLITEIGIKIDKAVQHAFDKIDV